MKRLIPAAAITATILAFATPALAHNGGITAACNSGQPKVTVNLTNYNGTNTISIKVDGGAELTPGTFGSSFSKTYPAGDPFTAHTVVYKVVAHDGPTNAAWSPSGTLTIPACQVTPPTTAPPATTTPPTTAPPATTTPPTTAPPATTTPPTTAPPATTAPATTEPATTVAPETTQATEAPTTTEAVIVAVIEPPVPTAPPAPAQGLPATGATTDGVWQLALALTAIGGALIFARRRSSI